MSLRSGFLSRFGKQFQFMFRKAFKSESYLFANASSRASSWKSYFPFKKIAVAVCCLGMSGGAYGYLTAAPERKVRTFSSAIIDVADPYVLKVVPDTKPSRHVDGPAKKLGLKLTLYQYQTCPFCCKVRAFLDYHGIPYDIIEVNPVMRQQIKFSEYKKVPILIVRDKKGHHAHQLNDSSVIISIMGTFLTNIQDAFENVLKTYTPIKYTNEEGKEITEVMNRYFLMYDEKAYTSRTDEEIESERKWRKWADEELVHILSPNIYRTKEEAFQAFNYFSEVGEWEKNFSNFERQVVIYVGATAMYLVGKRLKKKYKLKDNVRESLYDACRLWMKNIGNSKFMGGGMPNFADLAVYGMLSSIEGCTAFKDLLSQTNIGQWYYSVQDVVKNHEGYKALHPHLQDNS